jgi:hypothetical protein
MRSRVRLRSNARTQYAGHPFARDVRADSTLLRGACLQPVPAQHASFRDHPLGRAWDPSDTDRESIPTIVELFNEPALVEQIARETHDLYANEAQPADPDASSDPEDVAARKAWWTKDWTMFAEQAAQQVRQQLAFAADQGGRDSGVAPADSAHGFSARLHRQQSDATRLLH